MVKDAPKPVITQEEILAALNLQIAKIRFVDIPAGHDLGLEITQMIEGRPRRSFARLNVRPRGDSIDLLLSAQHSSAGCHRVEISFKHGADSIAVMSMDLEKQFGTTAVPEDPHGSSFFAMTTNAFRYEPGAAYQLARFYLQNDRKHRHFEITLFSYPIDGVGLPLRSPDGVILLQDPNATR